MSKRGSTPEPSLITQAVWLGRWFTGARREGFLAQVPPEAWHTLSAVLSFTTHDGRRVFSLDQLAATLGTGRDEARHRLHALAALEWHNAPLLAPQQAADGELVGALLLPIELLTLVQPAPGLEEESASPPPASSSLREALARVGLNSFQVDWLLRTYSAGRIQRQLDWLPAREAHNPPALLIRAIEQDWDAPKEAS